MRPYNARKLGAIVGVLIAVRQFGNTEGHKIGLTRSELNSISVEYAYLYQQKGDIRLVLRRRMPTASHIKE